MDVFYNYDFYQEETLTPYKYTVFHSTKKHPVLVIFGIKMIKFIVISLNPPWKIWLLLSAIKIFFCQTCLNNVFVLCHFSTLVLL